MDCSLSPLVPRFLVSEYQYYDSRALDRPLTRNEAVTGCAATGTIAKVAPSMGRVSLQ